MASVRSLRLKEMGNLTMTKSLKGRLKRHKRRRKIRNFIRSLVPPILWREKQTYKMKYLSNDDPDLVKAMEGIAKYE